MPRVEFLYLLRLIRPEAFQHPTQAEERSIDEHFRRLQRALLDGRLVIAGPCLDATFGVVIFRATSESEARAFMEEDPAVRDGVMSAELHPFRVSLISAPQLEGKEDGVSL